MVPPLGFIRSGPAPRSRRNFRHSAEKASANSKTSISAGRRPARAMTSSTALWPAVSITTGLTAVVAAARMRPRGAIPAVSAASSVPISRSAAASAIWGDVPTVCRCSIDETPRNAFNAISSWPSAPSCAKAGGSAASDSNVVPGRTNSSWSSPGPRSVAGTATTDPQNTPSAQALAALSWVSTPYRSSSSRPNPSMVALRSAAIPICTDPTARMVAGSAHSGPRSANIGTRETDSTPPATARPRSPVRTRAAACATASMPEAQNRLRVTPGTPSPQPASTAAVRAILAPCSSTCDAHPTTTSSTRAVSSPVRSTRACWR